ncbi:MAG: STAS domain-containing protein [Spirochaetota bacterium]
MPGIPEISTYENDIAVFIHVSGEISLYHTEALKKKMQRIIAKNDERLLFCFNFAAVSYIDSSGIGLITVIAKELHRDEKRLVMCCVNDDIRSLFELVQLTKIVPMFGSEADVC